LGIATDEDVFEEAISQIKNYIYAFKITCNNKSFILDSFHGTSGCLCCKGIEPNAWGRYYHNYKELRRIAEIFPIWDEWDNLDIKVKADMMMDQHTGEEYIEDLYALKNDRDPLFYYLANFWRNLFEQEKVKKNKEKNTQ
jgi:hypothetical protein